MGERLRIVNYAVNGGGIGHLVRLIAVNRWLRRHLAERSAKAEIYFLTTSDADSLLVKEQMAAFKLPSLTSAVDSGMEVNAHGAMARHCVLSALAMLQPDLLIVDTWPRGSFDELMSCIDLSRKCAFIYRPMRAEVAERPEFQGMLTAYDVIVVPEYAAHAPVPAGCEARLSFVGPVMCYENDELVPRDVARAQLGIDASTIACYVSLGGGGATSASDLLPALVAPLLDDPRLHVVVGAGPLYRGPVMSGPRVTWLAGAHSELVQAYDFALCSSGYNTFNELMHAGIPCIFTPLEKVADEQGVRAQRAVSAGAGALLENCASLKQTIEPWLSSELRSAASRAARALVPQNHARDAASAILRGVGFA